MSPTQSPAEGLLDRPIYPGMLGLRSDFAPARALSRKTPWQRHRIGFVGSRAAYDHLRYECETIILDPGLAGRLLAAGMLDVIVLEGAADEVSGRWRHGFFDYASGQPEARALLAAARAHQVPVVAYLNGPAGRLLLFLPLAEAADHVVVTSALLQEHLAARGIEAHLVPAPVQTALFNGFGHMAAGAGASPPLLSFDLERATTDPAVVDLLRSLRPFGLRLCALEQHIQPASLPDLRNLARLAQGSVTGAQSEALLAGHDILVQLARGERDDGAAWQIGLNAAASRMSVLVLGAPAPDDPRPDVAMFCADAAELRAEISRLLMAPLEAEIERQRSWRRAHRHHGAHHLAARIAALCGLPGGNPFPRASIVAPSHRPERLPQILGGFRAQSWPDRELIIVANTDQPDAWDTSLLSGDGAEQIMFLPRDHAAGMAMSLGAGRAGGDYVMRMDDDDHYGPAYVEDMMLAAAALAPDILGKPPIFWHFVDEDRFLWQAECAMRPSVYESAHIAEPNAGHLSGYTHTIRRELLDQIGFAADSRSAADAGLLHMARDAGDLLCACVDAMNAVIERRRDPASHTWRRAFTSDHQSFQPVPMTLAAFLAPDAR
ncbi:MAG: glycosyltransferase [Paracoccus sp. (in: a-proteobacteria)]|nr:glycosyltransferase [Paracoccus sp. (in: a-proteobacteria)]